MSELNYKTVEDSVDTGRAFNSDNIPKDGYLLGKAETVRLSLKTPSDRQPEGEVSYLDGTRKPYKTIARLRIGGDKTFEDVELVAAEDPYDSEDYPFIVRKLSNGMTMNFPVGYFSRTTDGVMGRDTLDGFPDTVSRTHVRVSFDNSTGFLSIENLNPTNETILLPPEEKDNHTSREPREMVAEVATDPITGEQHTVSRDSEEGIRRLNQLAQETSSMEGEVGIYSGQAELLAERAARATRRRRLARQQAQNQQMHY